MLGLVKEYNGCLILESQLVIYHNRKKKVSHNLINGCREKKKNTFDQLEMSFMIKLLAN